jgi:exopolyphosphatase/guanosine-5'-triphosphate,3'-diphosphate pyrophosphatase
MEMDTTEELNNNQRVAIIDCGTNTFNLLVKEKVEGKWKTLFKTKLPVKLGAGGFSENVLMPNRMARGVDALYSYKNVIDSLEVKDVRVFATSAVREASNGNVFVAKVKKHLNFDMEVISGDREAELIFEGVVQTTGEIKEDFLIMDIGGGSTEFIFVRNQKPLWRKSYLLGVSRLHGMLDPASRINQDDVNRLRTHLNKELQDLISFLKENPVKILVGSSGSFDTLFDMYQFGVAEGSSKGVAQGSVKGVAQDAKQVSAKGVAQGSSKGPSAKPTLLAPFTEPMERPFTEPFTEPTERSMNLNEIPFSSYPSIHQWLVGSTLEERLKHPSIPQMRAEYMPLSTYLVKFVLEQSSFNKMYQSEYALKEGVLAHYLS